MVPARHVDHGRKWGLLSGAVAPTIRIVADERNSRKGGRAKDAKAFPPSPPGHGLAHGPFGSTELRLQSNTGLRIQIDPGSATVADIRRFLRALSDVNVAAGKGALVFEVEGTFAPVNPLKDGE